MMSVDQPAPAVQESAAQPDEVFKVGQQVLAVNKTQLYVAKVSLGSHPSSPPCFTQFQTGVICRLANCAKVGDGGRSPNEHAR